MNSSEAIEYFQKLGILDSIITSASGRCLLLEVSATDRVAFEFMSPFGDLDGFWKGRFGIDAITSDGVPIVMTYLQR